MGLVYAGMTAAVILVIAAIHQALAQVAHLRVRMLVTAAAVAGLLVVTTRAISSVTRTFFDAGSTVVIGSGSPEHRWLYAGAATVGLLIGAAVLLLTPEQSRRLTSPGTWLPPLPSSDDPIEDPIEAPAGQPVGAPAAAESPLETPSERSTADRLVPFGLIGLALVLASAAPSPVSRWLLGAQRQGTLATDAYSGLLFGLAAVAIVGARTRAAVAVAGTGIVGAALACGVAWLDAGTVRALTAGLGTVAVVAAGVVAVSTLVAEIDVRSLTGALGVGVLVLAAANLATGYANRPPSGYSPAGGVLPFRGPPAVINCPPGPMSRGLPAPCPRSTNGFGWLPCPTPSAVDPSGAVGPCGLPGPRPSPTP